MEIGLPHSLDGKLHHAKVQQWIVKEEGRPAHMNQLLETRQYEDEYKMDQKQCWRQLARRKMLRRCQITVWQKKQ
jgi:hypothetical protein